MSEEYHLRSIYLYKPLESENFTNAWVYYRVDSIRGPDEEAGTLQAPIQICRVSWPSFEDILPPTDSPGITGLATAYNQMCEVVKTRWGVDHDQSVFIGFLEIEGGRR